MNLEYEFNKESIPKELEKVSAVYRIRNRKNNKFYIGSSTCIRKRFMRHIRELNILSEHHCKSLQEDFGGSSTDNFVFEILELCEGKECFKKEQEYLDKYFGKDFIYNENPKALGIEHTEEIRKRMSENHADVSGKNNYFYGKHLTGEKNAFYGRKHSEESKRRMSESRKGKKLSAEHRAKISANSAQSVKVIDVLTGEIFSRITDCQKKVGQRIRIGNDRRYHRYDDFMSLPETGKIEEAEKIFSVSYKYIVRLSDNKMYLSMSSCAKENGLSRSELENQLKGKTKEVMFSYLGKDGAEKRKDEILKILK